MLARSTLQEPTKIYIAMREGISSNLHLHRHTFITNAVSNNVSHMMLKRITWHANFTILNKHYNDRRSDLVEVIDHIASKSNKKESLFKKGTKR